MIPISFLSAGACGLVCELRVDDVELALLMLSKLMCSMLLIGLDLMTGGSAGFELQSCTVDESLISPSSTSESDETERFNTSGTLGGSDFTMDVGIDSVVLISLSDSESLRVSLTLDFNALFCFIISRRFFNILLTGCSLLTFFLIVGLCSWLSMS